MMINWRKIFLVAVAAFCLQQNFFCLAYDGYYVSLWKLQPCTTNCAEGAGTRKICLNEVRVWGDDGREFQLSLNEFAFYFTSTIGDHEKDLAGDGDYSTYAQSGDSNPNMAVFYGRRRPTSVTYYVCAGYEGYLQGATVGVNFNDEWVYETTITSNNQGTLSFGFPSAYLSTPYPSRAPTPPPTKSPTSDPTAL